MMLAMLLLVGWLHMATLLLTTMFGYLALRTFAFGRSKTLAVVLFSILLAAISFSVLHFGKRAYQTFPALADKTIPKVNELVDKIGVELPFTNHVDLAEFAMKEAKVQFKGLREVGTALVFQIVYLIIGGVVAVSVFFNSKLNLHQDPSVGHDSLYALTAHELMLRFRTFYASFRVVMGAQILISLINSLATGVFLFAAGFPNPLMLTVFTFACGLLPIVGNLISNSVITAVGLNVSPNMALLALGYLVVIHKFEYFLNSKIIGSRIKNPMWLTLIGLLIGERIMGIPGMILAPVLLHYIKVETSTARVPAGDPAAGRN
jgi:predicted PurR-regulated permease PerM